MTAKPARIGFTNGEEIRNGHRARGREEYYPQGGDSLQQGEAPELIARCPTLRYFPSGNCQYPVWFIRKSLLEDFVFDVGENVWGVRFEV